MGLAGEVCRWGCEGAAAGLRGGPPVSDFFVEMVSKPAYRPCVSVFRAAVWLRQAYVRFWVPNGDIRSIQNGTSGNRLILVGRVTRRGGFPHDFAA